MAEFAAFHYLMHKTDAKGSGPPSMSMEAFAKQCGLVVVKGPPTFDELYSPRPAARQIHMSEKLFWRTNERVEYRMVEVRAEKLLLVVPTNITTHEVRVPSSTSALDFVEEYRPLCVALPLLYQLVENKKQGKAWHTALEKRVLVDAELKAAAPEFLLTRLQLAEPCPSTNRDAPSSSQTPCASSVAERHCVLAKSFGDEYATLLVSPPPPLSTLVAHLNSCLDQKAKRIWLDDIVESGTPAASPSNEFTKLSTTLTDAPTIVTTDAAAAAAAGGSGAVAVRTLKKAASPKKATVYFGCETLGDEHSAAHSIPRMPQLVQWDEGDEEVAASAEGGGGGDDDSIFNFTLLLLEEFCKHHQMVHCTHALKLDLEHMHRPHPTADLWMHMYDRCRPLLASMRQQRPDHTTAECMVAFLLHFHDAYEPKTTAQHISVLVSSPAKRKPKKSFSFMQAFHSVQSPVKRPSQQHKKGATNQDHVTDETTAHGNVPPNKPPKKKKPKPVKTTTLVPPPHTTTPDDTSLPKLKFEETDWKRTTTTIKSVERGMREMRFEAHVRDTLEKTIAKAFPAALPSHLPPPESTYARELEKERCVDQYGTTKRRDCGLCHISFLAVNLPARVSFRCIMELYDRWAYVPPDRENAKYRPPKCYDQVPICRFCDQLVQDVTWDPSFETLATTGAARPTLARASTTTTVSMTSSSSSKYCPDPYALPPLAPDDFASSDDEGGPDVDMDAYFQPNKSLAGGGGGNGGGPPLDSPAKTVYKQANYLAGERMLTRDEWSLLDKSKSDFRRTMERATDRAKASRS
ncbi:Aste57867_9294 [Aphanomyces stellatus]|uniref:Aste57867_9294 protein n=1 Tax=Aphanomyces stellatus TaxID=120398 RepID=A0A485KMP0_9STRA|nr:hypothetical protein As57867_009258 [Aphanomyces stellatus]VFT86176.1 Aste57867_9294 [Aphanomyces stellatus]